MGSLPVGTTLDWPPGQAVPDNWSRGGGAALSRSSYAALSEIFPAGQVDPFSSVFGVPSSATSSALTSGAKFGVDISGVTNSNFLLADATKVTKFTSWFSDTLKLTVSGGTSPVIIGMDMDSSGRIWVFHRDTARTVYGWYSDDNGDNWTASATISVATGTVGVYRVRKCPTTDDWFILPVMGSNVSYKAWHSTDPSAGWTAIDFGTYIPSANSYLLDVVKCGPYWLFLSAALPSTGFSAVRNTVWYTSNLTGFGYVRYPGSEVYTDASASYAGAYTGGFAQDPNTGRAITSIAGNGVVVFDRSHPYGYAIPGQGMDVFLAANATTFNGGGPDNYDGYRNFTIDSLTWCGGVFVMTGGANGGYTRPNAVVLVSSDGVQWKAVTQAFSNTNGYPFSYYSGGSGGWGNTAINYLAQIAAGVSYTHAPIRLIPHQNGVVVSGGNQTTSLVYFSSATNCWNTTSGISLPNYPGKIIKVK